MTYTEFEKTLNEMGYKYLNYDDCIKVIKQHGVTEIIHVAFVRVYKDQKYKMDSDLGAKIDEDLFNLCFELASTPLEERAAVELYYLIADLDEIVMGKGFFYLNYDVEENSYNISGNTQTESYQTKFTLQEIEKMNIKGFKKEKVE